MESEKIDLNMLKNNERHIQTFMQLALIALVGWMANTTQNTEVEFARLSERVAGLSERVAGLVIQLEQVNKLNKDAYTLEQAARDWKARDVVIQEFISMGRIRDTQIEKLEERVRKLEGALR